MSAKPGTLICSSCNYINIDSREQTWEGKTCTRCGKGKLVKLLQRT